MTSINPPESNAGQPVSSLRSPETAAALYAALGGAFPCMECRKALYGEATVEAAVRALVSGRWRFAKLISWDFASLNETTERICATGLGPSNYVLEVLKDCAGSEALALKVLRGEPILDAATLLSIENAGKKSTDS